MSFSFDKFLRPITPTDRNIKIYEDNGILKYTINPFHIKNVNVLNNTMRINLDSDRSIAMVFSTNNEAKISLSKLQGQLDTLQQKVPFIIDKDILNYVTAHIKIGPTGSNGRIFTGTSSTNLTIPNSGNLVQLTTQKDLAFVPGQTIVVYQDFPTNYYVEDYLDEPYYDYSNPVYMVGDIDTYDSTTGQLAFVANNCQTPGLSASFWYINLTGQRGQDGTSGTSGASAYQIWLNNGSPNSQGDGSEIDFLEAYRGPQGIQGFGGLNGSSGTSGLNGTSGISSYQIWLNNGSPNSQGDGSELDFLESYRGPQGIQGFQGLMGLTGSSGESGTSGTTGTSGTSGTTGTSGTSGITPTTDWSLSGSLSVSGTVSLTGHTIFSETSEVINVTPGATASTVVYDFNTGVIWYHATASTNYTANFTSMPTTNNRVITTTIMISQGSTGYIPTEVQIEGSAKAIKWANGTYSVSSNKVDIIGLTFVSAGGDWAQVLGQISSFG